MRKTIAEKAKKAGKSVSEFLSDEITDYIWVDWDKVNVEGNFVYWTSLDTAAKADDCSGYAYARAPSGIDEYSVNWDAP